MRLVVWRKREGGNELATHESSRKVSQVPLQVSNPAIASLIKKEGTWKEIIVCGVEKMKMKMTVIKQNAENLSY